MEAIKSRIIATGFIFHMLAAWFSVGYHQCDELFQVYEFAGYKLGLNKAAEMPWEFATQMRSGIEPLFVYAATKILNAISVTNPFYIATFLRLLMALFSFFAIKKFLSIIAQELSSEKSRLALWAAGLLLWCLPYFHARLSSENFASLFFLLGFNFLLKKKGLDARFWQLMLAGFLFGIAFVCRFQLAFMLAGLAGWLLFVDRAGIRTITALTLGFALSLGFGMLVDKWLYNKWVLSWWNYFYQNLFEDKASFFGKAPFYFYIGEALLQLIPPFSLVIVAVIIGFWIRFKKHVLTWITLPFILLHFFVAHKELRFLFPVLNFLPAMLLLYFQSAANSSNKLLKIIRSRKFVVFAAIVNVLLLLFFTFKPADEISNSLERIYALAKGEHPVLYCDGRGPYNKRACLNYFRNPNVITVNINTDTTQTAEKDVYFFEEKFGSEKLIKRNGKSFERIYSNFPAWFSHFNVNNWLDRAHCYSLYKMQE